MHKVAPYPKHARLGTGATNEVCDKHYPTQAHAHMLLHEWPVADDYAMRRDCPSPIQPSSASLSEDARSRTSVIQSRSSSSTHMYRRKAGDRQSPARRISRRVAPAVNNTGSVKPKCNANRMHTSAQVVGVTPSEIVQAICLVISAALRSQHHAQHIPCFRARDVPEWLGAHR